MPAENSWYGLAPRISSALPLPGPAVDWMAGEMSGARAICEQGGRRGALKGDRRAGLIGCYSKTGHLLGIAHQQIAAGERWHIPCFAGDGGESGDLLVPLRRGFDERNVAFFRGDDQLPRCEQQ